MAYSDDTSGPFGRRVTRRQVLKGALAVGAAAGLGPVISACGGDGGGGEGAGGASPTSGGNPKKGGVLRSGIVGGSAKDTLDPHVAINEPENANGFQLYNRLIEYTPDQKLENVLAESVESNADATVWTVRLKPDIVYSDGKPVTADDVVFSFNRIIDPDAPKGGASALAMLTPSGIRKVDDRTVQFTLETPNAVFPEALAYRENTIVRQDIDVKNPVGTGPFKVKSFAPGEQTVYVPNENYFGEGPYVDELQIIQFADPTARVNALLSGVIDHCDQVASGQLAAVQGTDGYAIWETRSGGWIPFTMRIDQKPFDDVRVRQAFRLIADRQQMVDQAFAGYGWVGNDMYAPYDTGYPSDLPQREQDLDQAKSLLKQAGYDGLSVELVTSTAVGNGGVEAAQVFAEQAKGAGVTVAVNKVDPGVFYGEDYLKWTFAMDFWGTRNYLPQTTVGTLPTAPYNETHWENAEWLAIVEEAFRTPDDGRRNELVAQASKIEHEEGGLIVWSFNQLLDAHSEKLQGLVHDVASMTAMGFRYRLCHFA